MDDRSKLRPLKPLPNLIFMSRWLQLPLYLGLIVAQGIYVWLFWQELYYLVLAAFGNEGALVHILDAVTVEGAAKLTKLNETVIMLVVLGLIDVVMISNL
ncbi:MAG: YqhA family protein, partial [Usitatibacter sp.]